MTPYWVVLGPRDSAGRYAMRQGWDERNCAVVGTAEELRLLDPLTMRGVALVDVAELPTDEVAAVALEMWILRTVWPEIRIEAPVDVAAQVDAGRVPVLC